MAEYTPLTKENMFDVFLNDKPIEIKGDVAEIIERPLYYRVMIIPFMLEDHQPAYISVDFYKEDTLTENSWKLFYEMKPFTSIKVRAAQNHKYSFRVFTANELICVNTHKTINYIQYCKYCDTFTFVESPTDYRQCCRDNGSGLTITKTPLETRAKILNKYKIAPDNLPGKVFTNKDILYNDYYNGLSECPFCGYDHPLPLIIDGHDQYLYCSTENKAYKMILKVDEEIVRKRMPDFDKQKEKENETMKEEIFAKEAESDLKQAQSLINAAKQSGWSAGEISDGYHTFNELYHHRALLFASLCMTTFKNKAWKSLLHADPNEPMYPGMFIVGVETPDGQATYHYDIDPYWAIFKNIKELDRAPKYDGHTPAEAIDRIYNYALKISGETIIRGSITSSDSDFFNIPINPCSDSSKTTGSPYPGLRDGVTMAFNEASTAIKDGIQTMKRNINETLKGEG